MRIKASSCFAAVVAMVAAAVGALPAGAAPAAAVPIPVLEPVHDLAAFEDGHGVRLTWSFPRDPLLGGFTVRYAQGGAAPALPTEGLDVPLGKPTDRSARLTGLTPGTRYSVSVWVYNSAHDYSRRAVTRFTTLPAREPDGTISGTVTDTDGHPLEHVQVFIETFAATALSRTFTDADGAYSLTARPGGYYIGFDGGLASGGNSDATGYVADLADAVVSPGAETTGVDATLHPGAAITGRVRDAAGHPLAGVVPSAELVQPYVRTTTSSSIDFAAFFGTTLPQPSAGNGRFAIKGLPHTTVQVCFDPSVNVVTGGVSDDVGYLERCTNQSVTTAIGRTRAIPDTALAGNRGGLLTGVVRDPSGQPVANAFVSAESAGFRGGYGYRYSGPDGSFRMPLPPGQYRVCADAPRVIGVADDGRNLAGTCAAADIPVDKGAVVSADLRLAPAGSLAGRITGPGGDPVPHALVDVHPVRHGPGSYGFGATDERGFFDVTGLAPGSYVVCIYAFDGTEEHPTGFANLCAGRANAVSIRIGATRLGFDVRLAVGGAISGVVTDDLGHPLGNALVDAYRLGGGASSDIGVNPDGTFSLTGLRAGTYYVCPIWLPPGDGSFFFGFFEPPCRSPAVAVTAGEEVSGVHLTVPTRGELSVSVTDGGGQPLGGVNVTAVRPCKKITYACEHLPLHGDGQVKVVGSAMTDADGNATLYRLPAGQYAVCLFAYYASSAAHEPRTGYADSCNGSGFDVTVADHVSTQVDRVLDTAGAVSGTVTDAAGDPLAGVAVSVSNSAITDYGDPEEYYPPQLDGPARDAVTDADGHFLVRGVQPGGQTVCFDAARAHGSSSTGYVDSCVGASTVASADLVDVRAGRTTTVRSTLAEGAAISGHAVAGTGRQFRATVFVVRRGGGGAAATVHRDGSYRISRLPAGTYRVCFVAFRYQAECFRNVAWTGRRLPVGAVKFTLAPGEERAGVDAVLTRAAVQPR